MRNNTNYENIALNTTYKTSLNCFLIGLLDTNLNWYKKYKSRLQVPKGHLSTLILKYITVIKIPIFETGLVFQGDFREIHVSSTWF